MSNIQSSLCSLWASRAGIFIALGLMLALPARAQNAPASSQVIEPPATVHFENRDIAILRATLGPLTPQERAAAAESRLGLSSRDLAASVTVVPYGEARGILLGDRMVFGIVPEDVDASAGETVDGAAAIAAANLRGALEAWSKQRRPDVILGGATRVLAATFFAFLALFALRWLRGRLLKGLISQAEHRLESGKLVMFGRDLRQAAAKASLWVVGFLTGAAVVVLVYSWLTYSLSQFPLTEPWGRHLAGFLLDALKGVAAALVRGVPGLFMVAVIFSITRLVARLASLLFDAVERGQIKMRGVHPDTADATRRIATVLLWIFGIALAYPYIPGSNSEAFKGISVLVGLMVSMGSSGVINQAMSGLVVVFSRALKAGEYVCVGEFEGTVTEVGGLSTKIRTPRNEEINIPNALLVSSTTKNFSRLAKERGVMVFATVAIGYMAPWRRVHELLIEAARRTNGLRRDPAPFVRQSSLSSFYVEYAINAYLERPDSRIETLSNLHANIQDTFNDAAIQIMTPAFESQPEEPVLAPKGAEN
jgi:small-conductance mechanosensitive channel